MSARILLPMCFTQRHHPVGRKERRKHSREKARIFYEEIQNNFNGPKVHGKTDSEKICSETV